MGGPPGGDPMGGMGGMPPMGGPPGMGGPGMGGGQPEPPPVPMHGDVWDVLDSLLNQKPLEQEKKLQSQKQNAALPPAGPNMAPPSQEAAPPPEPAMGGPHLQS